MIQSLHLELNEHQKDSQKMYKNNTTEVKPEPNVSYLKLSLWLPKEFHSLQRHSRLSHLNVKI